MLYIILHIYYVLASQVVLVVKDLPANAGDIKRHKVYLWLGRSPGGGHGNTLNILAWRIP